MTNGWISSASDTKMISGRSIFLGKGLVRHQSWFGAGLVPGPLQFREEPEIVNLGRCRPFLASDRKMHPY